MFALGLAILVLLAVLPFLPTLKNEFVWDDQEFIINNRTIRDIFPLSRFFHSQGLVTTGDIFPISGSRPVMIFSLALDYRFGKLNPLGYHVTNLILHVLCVFGVALLAYELIHKWFAAGFAGAFFAVLPGHAEAVIALLGRSDLLATLFVIAGFLCYTQYANRKIKSIFIYLASVIMYIFACLSKETGLVLVFIIVGYEFFVRRNRSVRQFILKTLPFVAVATIYLIYRGWILHGNTAGLEWWGGSAAKDFLMMLEVYARYWRILILPVVLSPMHMVPVPTGFFNFGIFFGSILVAGTVVLTVIAQKKSAGVGFFVFWFIAALLPVANILPIPGMIMAERWLYMPTVGLCALAGLGAVTLSEKAGSGGRRLWRGGLALLLILYGVRVAGWCPVWKTNESVARAILKTSPQSHTALNNLGNAFLVNGRYREAEDLFHKALVYKPDYGIAHLNLAMVLRQEGRLAEAQEECRKAVAFDPGNPDTYSNLGVIYWNLGRPRDAIEQFMAAIKLKPENAQYHYNLGLAFNDLGMVEQALGEFRIIVVLDPKNIDARLYIGYALGKLGKLKEAEAALRDVLTIKYDLPEAHYNLAGALEAQGRIAEAIEEYEKYLTLAPDAENRTFVADKIKKLKAGE
jgi:tetratricopeptide (TPR) repeat protein